MLRIEPVVRSPCQIVYTNHAGVVSSETRTFFVNVVGLINISTHGTRWRKLWLHLGASRCGFLRTVVTQHGVAAASTRNSGMRLTREPVRPSRIRHHTLGSTNRFSEGVSKRLMARLDAATRGIDAPLNAHAEPAQHQLATAAAAAMGGQTPSSTLNSAQMLHNDLATNTNAFNSTTGSLNDVYNNSLNNNSFTSPPLSPKASLSRLQQGLNVDAPSFDLGDPRRALSPPPGGWRDATATAVAGVHQSINGSLLLRKQLVHGTPE